MFKVEEKCNSRETDSLDESLNKAYVCKACGGDNFYVYQKDRDQVCECSYCQGDPQKKPNYSLFYCWRCAKEGFIEIEFKLEESPSRPRALIYCSCCLRAVHMGGLYRGVKKVDR